MRQIILASSSPRREQLLKQMGVKFKVVPSDFDEQLDDNRPTEEVAAELGLGKAMAVAKKFPKALVIGSDTIVTLDGKQLGKPTDRADAEALLKAHDGKTVTVTTSLALVCLEIDLQEVTTDTTTVRFKKYDPKRLEAYLASGDWHDKAGGWGIQSGAAPLIESIAGECDTILGLPTYLLADMLENQGIPASPVEVEPPVLRQQI